MHEPDADVDLSKLLKAAQADDPDALDALLKLAHRNLALAAVQQIPAVLRSKLAESDLVQQSLIEVVRELPNFSGSDWPQFRTWLQRILHRRAARAKRRFLGTERRDVGRERDLGLTRNLPAKGKTPSSLARRQETDEQLVRAIAELPDNYRTVVESRHKQGKSWEEVGAQLGISAEAARKLWARAIKQLQQQLLPTESNVV